MKKNILLVLIMLLAACTPKTESIEYKYVIPAEFSDCVFKRMTNSDGYSITVVRCPNSTTSAIQGDKSQTTSITIDGVKYTPTQ